MIGQADAEAAFLEAWQADRLHHAAVPAHVAAVGASLEDVFVAATGFRRTTHVAADGD